MESDALALLERVVHPGNFVVDVGASSVFGREDWVRPLSRRVGPRGMVYAFDIVDMPEFPWGGNIWKVERVAVWDKGGKVRLNGDCERMQYLEDEEGQPFETVALDDFFAALEINFLKVDVEGAEWRVFLGARELLRRSPVFVVWESHHEEIEKFGGTEEGCHELLLECGLMRLPDLANGTRCYQKG